MQETWVQSLSQEDSPEKEMVNHSSIRAWEIAWTEEPGSYSSQENKSWIQISNWNTITTTALTAVFPSYYFFDGNGALQDRAPESLELSSVTRPSIFLIKFLCLLNIVLVGLQFSQSSRSVMSDSLRPHESQHTRPPCPSPTPRVHSNSCPSCLWCHPAISSSVVPLSSCPQSLPASESFPVTQLIAWGGQSTGLSALASVLSKNTQD